MPIHPSSIVEDGAVLADDVEVGPFCIIHSGAKIGSGCVFTSHSVVHGCVTMGSNNVFHQSCSVGDLPQDFKDDGSASVVEIGSNNIFREFTTIHRGTAGGGGITKIGDDNYFMAYAHVAHDCFVGNGTTFGNLGTLAGHVVVEDFATVGPFSGVHQNCRVGKHGWIGAFSLAVKDVVPYSKTVGNRAKVYGPNVLGLERKGLSKDAISNIRQAYRILFQSKLNTSQALEKIEEEIKDSPEVDYIVEFIRSAKRGITK